MLLQLGLDARKTFFGGFLGQVWYLIVSISDLCNLSYFANNTGGDQTALLRSLISAFVIRF